jgi:hypothetical protein
MYAVQGTVEKISRASAATKTTRDKDFMMLLDDSRLAQAAQAPSSALVSWAWFSRADMRVAKRRKDTKRAQSVKAVKEASFCPPFMLAIFCRRFMAIPLIYM